MPDTITLWPLLLATGFALQMPGAFHGDEPIARDGESWLALRVDDDAAALAAAKIKVRAVQDPLLDEENDRSGLEVSSAADDHVLAYMRGRGLKAREVERARVEQADPQVASVRYMLNFRSQEFRIFSECDTQPRDASADFLQFDCRIVLQAGARKQTISTVTGFRQSPSGDVVLGEDANPTLLFAGDLDSDGKLDLIFDTTDHYNLSRPTLFLSSQSRPGELLHQVAQYASVGC